MLTFAEDRTARLWQISTPHSRALVGHDDLVYAARFSPDGSRLLSGSADGTARLWNIASGASQVLQGHTDLVWCVAFSADGACCLTGSRDGTVRIWNMEGCELHRLSESGAWVLSVEVAPQAPLMVSAGKDQRALIYAWDGHGPPALCAEVQHEGDVNRAVFGPGVDPLLLTASHDGHASVWRRQDKTFVRAQTFVHAEAVRSATFSPDGAWVLTACEDGIARLWSLHTGATAPALELADHNAKLFSAEFSADGRAILTTSRDGTVRKWTRDGRRVARLAAEEQAIWSAQFSPRRDWVAVCASDGIVRLLWEDSDALLTKVTMRDMLPQEAQRLAEIRAEIIGR